MAVLCAFMLGFGDSAFNTQVSLANDIALVQIHNRCTPVQVNAYFVHISTSNQLKGCLNKSKSTWQNALYLQLNSKVMIVIAVQL